MVQWKTCPSCAVSLIFAPVRVISFVLCFRFRQGAASRSALLVWRATNLSALASQIFNRNCQAHLRALHHEAKGSHRGFVTTCPGRLRMPRKAGWNPQDVCACRERRGGIPRMSVHAGKGGGHLGRSNAATSLRVTAPHLSHDRRGCGAALATPAAPRSHLRRPTPHQKTPSAGCPGWLPNPVAFLGRAATDRGRRAAVAAATTHRRVAQS